MAMLFQVLGRLETQRGQARGYLELNDAEVGGDPRELLPRLVYLPTSRYRTVNLHILPSFAHICPLTLAKLGFVWWFFTDWDPIFEAPSEATKIWEKIFRVTFSIGK